MRDPKAVLAEHGMDVPDGMDLNVVENAGDCVYISLPKRPSGELSDGELEPAAGGGGAGQMASESGPGPGFINSRAS